MTKGEKREIGFVVFGRGKMWEIRLGLCSEKKIVWAPWRGRCLQQMSLGGNLWAIFRARAAVRPTMRKTCTHSRKKMRALEKKKKKTQCISNALAFHDFLWEGGGISIHSSQEERKLMHLMIFPSPPLSNAPFLHIYTILATQLPLPWRGREGRKKKSLFWGGCGGHALPDKQSRGGGTVSWHFYMKIEVEEVKFYSNLHLQTILKLLFCI